MGLFSKKKDAERKPRKKYFAEFRSATWLQGTFPLVWEQIKNFAPALWRSITSSPPESGLSAAQALINWGYGVDDESRNEARKTFLVMFYASLFLLFLGAAVTVLGVQSHSKLQVICGFGMANIFCVTMFVSHWRARVVEENKFIPFMTWVKTSLAGKSFFLFLLCLNFFIMTTAPEAADVEVPTDFKILNKNDITAQLFASLFGESWENVSGFSSPFKLASKYSGLLVECLKVLNVAALLYVSTYIFYVWGMMAAVTAHEGKAGGRMFNTMWVPLRHAFAVTITAPVINGMSVLQVMILVAIAFSINFANAVWNHASSYIQGTMHISLVTTAPPSMQNSAMRIAKAMFKAAVLQEIARKQYDDGMYAREIPKSDNISVLSYDLYAENKGGTTTLIFSVPKAVKPGSLGGVELEQSPMGSVTARNALMQSRINAYAQLYAKMQGAAKKYVDAKAKVKSDEARPYMDDGLKAYTKEIADGAEAFRESAKAELDKIIEDAMDTNTGDGPKHGWAGAGLFTFSIAHAQRKVDDAMFGTASALKNTVETEYDASDPMGYGPMVYSYYEYVKMDTTSKKLYDDADLFFDEKMSSREIRAPREADYGSLSKYIGWVLAGFDLGETDLITQTVSNLTENDPIVVLSALGNRWMAWGAGIFALSFGSSVINFGTAFFNHPIVLSVGAMLWGAGFVLSYILTAIPAIFWIRALLSWLFLVVESLVAAPFWAIAHAMPEGEGFAGQNARRCYMLFVDILVRPVLLVIGAVLSIVLIQAWGGFMNILLTLWLKALGSTNPSFGPVDQIVYSLIIGYVCYISCYTIFVKGVNHLPMHISRWIGGGAANLGEEDETMRTSGAAGAALYAGGRTVSGFAGQMAQNAERNRANTEGSARQDAQNEAKEARQDKRNDDLVQAISRRMGGGGTMAQSAQAPDTASGGQGGASGSASGAGIAESASSGQGSGSGMESKDNRTTS